MAKPWESTQERILALKGQHKETSKEVVLPLQGKRNGGGIISVDREGRTCPPGTYVPARHFTTGIRQLCQRKPRLPPQNRSRPWRGSRGALQTLLTVPHLFRRRDVLVALRRPSQLSMRKSDEDVASTKQKSRPAEAGRPFRSSSVWNFSPRARGAPRRRRRSR